MDENFKRAHKRNAILEEKFYTRLNIFDNEDPKIAELSLKDILLGSE